MSTCGGLECGRIPWEQDELIELRAFRASATSTIEILTEAASEAHKDLEALRAAVRTLLPLATRYAEVLSVSIHQSAPLECAEAREIAQAAKKLLGGGAVLSAIPVLHEQWLARAERFERAAAKLQQRARDIRHTAEMLRSPMAPVPRCEECSAYDGEEHYAFCTHPAALRGEFVS